MAPPNLPPLPQRSAGGGAGILVVVAVVALVVVGLVAALPSAKDQGPSPSSYASCASEHDADNSLFTDEQWCDLELNGGNGDGLADEGGVGSDPVESCDGGFPSEDGCDPIFGDSSGDGFGSP